MSSRSAAVRRSDSLQGGAIKKLIVGIFIKRSIFQEVKNRALTRSFASSAISAARLRATSTFAAGSMHIGKVECTGAYKALNHFTIRTLHADTKSMRPFEGSVDIAFFYYFIYESFTDAFDGDESKTNNAFTHGIKAADGFIDGWARS